MSRNLDRVNANVLDVHASYPAAPAVNGALLYGLLPGVADEAENSNSASQLYGTTPASFDKVYDLTVSATNDAGNSAIKGGDLIYYHPTGGTLSKVAHGGIFFGKVHGNPASTLVTAGESGSVPVIVGRGAWMPTVIDWPVFVPGVAETTTDVVIPFAGKLIDVVALQTGVGEANDTLTVQKAATALSNALAWSDTSAPFNLVRAATIVTASADFAAGDTLRCVLADDDSGGDLAPGIVLCKFLLL